MIWLSERLQKFLYKDIQLSKEEIEWLSGNFTKVCCQVDTEAELLDIFNKAKETKLLVYLVTDSGKTEFDNVPTNTCLAIGPNEAGDIDKITGGLKLY